MAAGITFMEVTGRKDVQNGGRSILKMTTGFGLFTFESQNLLFLAFYLKSSYFNNFKLPYKIRLLAFRSPLKVWIAHDAVASRERQRQMSKILSGKENNSKPKQKPNTPKENIQVHSSSSNVQGSMPTSSLF